MNKIHFLKPACVAGALLALTGCNAFNPIGESTFDCNRKENPSEYCRSFKAVEKSTNGNLPESRFDKEFKMSDFDRAAGVAPNAQAPQNSAEAKEYTSVLPHNRSAARDAPLAGAPVRRAPVIQRVLIKSYVDENDMLHTDSLVYKEVLASKWTGFNSNVQNVGSNGAFYPHKAQNSLTASVEQAAKPMQPANNFTQPGNQDMEETASSPAASGGNLSMPK